jgi:methanogenic corrinoid protein MtbC1
MIVGLLRQRGWQAHFLGADVALPFLLDATRLRRPDVVLLSASTEAALPGVQAAVEALQDATLPKRPTIVVGGAAVEPAGATLQQWGAATVTGASLQEVLKVIDQHA